jgi:bacteriorhodopsin
MSSYSSSSVLPTPTFTSPIPIAPAPPSPEPTKTLGVETQADKKEKHAHPMQYYIKASFMITYILLLTTATITFIEAVRTNIPEVRHVMNLETAISVIAGYFYSVFIAQIEEYGKKDTAVDWSDITKTRYIDWAVTTPLMLLTLCIVLGKEAKVKVPFSVLISVIALNYAMLYIGYLGETQYLGRWFASFVGFIPFTIMFYLIYRTFVAPKNLFSNQVLYWIYCTIWSMYGMVYVFNDEWKNISMNILDFIAKCFVGLGLWLYYSRTVVA